MVVFPALARPMIRTRKRGVSHRTFRARLCCLSTSSAPWNSVSGRDICVAEMPEMVEVMKNQGRRTGAVYCLVIHQPKEWRHSLTLSNFQLLLRWRTSLNFRSPFIQFFSLTPMEFSMHIHFKNPQLSHARESWHIFKPSLSTTNMEVRGFVATPTSSIQTPLTERRGRERVSTSC